MFCYATQKKEIRKSIFTTAWRSVLFITLAEEALCKGDFALHKLDIQTYTGLVSSVDKSWLFTKIQEITLDNVHRQSWCAKSNSGLILKAILRLGILIKNLQNLACLFPFKNTAWVVFASLLVLLKLVNYLYGISIVV